MQKRWHIKQSIERTTVESFRSSLKIDDVVAELLLQRGISSFSDAEQFFRPSLEDLHDPFLMKGMEKATERLQKALSDQQRIMLYGDYDVDGTTAVSMMYLFLKQHLDSIEVYIPDRYKEGYGVSQQGIDCAIEKDIELLITLDCGIRANEQLLSAKNADIDVIVCDHHEPGKELPEAFILDPKQKGCEYPFQELSGCGVAFKLLQALTIKNEWTMDKVYEQLDLLAVSIGADIVPVIGENRILAHHGMRLLNDFPRPAFRELLKLAKRSFPVTLTDVVFSIAPRINAAGRLRSGKEAVRLMTEENLDQIQEVAREIDQDNQERRELDQRISEEAYEMMAHMDENRKSNVLYSEDWHKGVVGIVASRVLEKSYLPTIVLTKSEGIIAGSARSVKGFDIHQAIGECESFLEQYGGHKYAAGMTLKPENLEQFSVAFEKVVSDTILPEQLVEEQEIDIELRFDQIFEPNENRMKIPKLKRIIRQFEPHGPDNMKPVFLSRNLFSTDVRVLKEAHLKLSVTQPSSDIIMEAIAFNMSDKVDLVAAGMPFDMVYTIEINRWKNRETLQLNVKDIRAI